LPRSAPDRFSWLARNSCCPRFLIQAEGDILGHTTYTTRRKTGTMQQFAVTAAIFEASMAVLAVALGWLFGYPPARTLHLDLHGLGIGIVATLPLLALLWLCAVCPVRPLKRITRIVEAVLVPPFRECSVMELAVLSALAGIGEELLFRGVVQTVVTIECGGPSGVWIGLAVAAVLFGLLHPITPTYAALAGLIGLYLGGLWLISGNLLAPMIAHGLYDFLALLYLIRRSGPVAEYPAEE
jgi:uncharacterized protein